MTPQRDIQAVLFDLDGTLLDTATDIANATNYVLTHHNKRTVPVSDIRPYIGGGVTGIIKKVFQLSPGDNHFNLIRQQVLQAYQQVMLQCTTLFPGMEELLTQLNTHAIPWGIITSKPTWLAEPLVSHLPPLQKSRILVGRETLPFIKPNPLPLTYAAQTIVQVAPHHCVYIGDALTDVQAAKAAKMYSVAAAYGYIHPQEDPKTWAADYLINSPYDLISWLEPRTLRG